MEAIASRLEGHRYERHKKLPSVWLALFHLRLEFMEGMRQLSFQAWKLADAFCTCVPL